MVERELLRITLRLFDGGNGTGASAAGEGDGSSVGETQGAVPGSTRRGKSGEYKGVVFGKQAAGGDNAGGIVTDTPEPLHDAGADTDVSVTSDTREERRKAFHDLVSGEYKDIYTEETQRMINSRFKETRSLEAQLKKQQGLMDTLAQRYGIPGADPDKLMAALENDDAYWSEAAEEAGMSVEQYKQFQKLKRENTELMRDQQGRQRQEKVQQQAREWFEQAQAVKAKFPKFDFAGELQKPEFTAMLRAGTPVEHAYKVLHFDELMDGAVQVTMADTEKRVADHVRARGLRPAENGTTSQSAFTIKDDPSKLTREDFEEIARRVARGESIMF